MTYGSDEAFPKKGMLILGKSELLWLAWLGVAIFFVGPMRGEELPISSAYHDFITEVREVASSLLQS